MKVYWLRILFVAGLILLIACLLRPGTWSSMLGTLSDFFGSGIVHFCFYLALALGIVLSCLWLASRVTGWFRR